MTSLRPDSPRARSPLRTAAHRLLRLALGAAVAALLTSATVRAQDASSPLDDLQDRMSNDPETMSTISALKDSPEVKALLDDHALMDALQRGDLDALLANPKIARLAADPRVQELTKKYGR
jgi:hypothetical protein